MTAPDRPSPALRTEALEQLLVERGLADPAVMDTFIRTYEQDVGPLNGAKVVARAWTDPAYREWLLRDGTAAIADLGFGGPQGEHMVVLEQTDEVHHVVVCTLCSCYPWPVLGLPPSWYKDPAYRAGMVRTPRKVLREMGLEVPEGRRIEVWDSSAEVRYLVLPRRPAGTEGLDADALAGLVGRDAMVGVAEVAAP
ncbi:nitrile hydratase subunit alpha [Actinomycetospora atypica]|uniref:nitrile hydratase n=1 Tax=Actinomycetospora atypica TaxID=1290095 RepID=A0ABV9YJM1_9PSEU